MEDGHLLPLLAEGNHNFFSRGSVLEISCPLSEFLKMGSCGMNLCEMDPELWETKTLVTKLIVGLSSYVCLHSVWKCDLEVPHARSRSCRLWGLIGGELRLDDILWPKEETA